jgi:hypothetical protein
MVTAQAAMADFACDDADDVDHTTFAVRKVSWEFVQSSSPSYDRFRLKAACGHHRVRPSRTPAVAIVGGGIAGVTAATR